MQINLSDLKDIKDLFKTKKPNSNVDNKKDSLQSKKDSVKKETKTQAISKTLDKSKDSSLVNNNLSLKKRVSCDLKKTQKSNGRDHIELKKDSIENLNKDKILHKSNVKNTLNKSSIASHPFNNALKDAIIKSNILNNIKDIHKSQDNGTHVYKRDLNDNVIVHDDTFKDTKKERDANHTQKRHSTPHDIAHSVIKDAKRERREDFSNKAFNKDLNYKNDSLDNDSNFQKRQDSKRDSNKDKLNKKQRKTENLYLNILDNDFVMMIEDSLLKVSYQNRRLIKKALYDLKYIAKDKLDLKKEELLSFVQKSIDDIALKKEHMPHLAYDDSLPASLQRQTIIDAIKTHQVVIIAGETGSGKTTQIPKMCIEAGLGVYGLIGHTQPRRIAARAVANRIAQEMGEVLGQSVGYKVRFTDITSDSAYIKLMTDGILLAETANDRLLLNYDCIIIDEAHERSLNIDFLLGYLKSILQKRPELKLIITSATIDPKRFSKHFNDAPIIEVSGRTYPVDVVYMPLVGQYNEDEEVFEQELDLKQGVLKAISYLMQEGPGDILVFLPGERDIMEMASFLKKANLRHTEILPLYARLATQEQNKIFSEHTGVRIVLSTNVAETSLTVPSIKYVIDPGLARISRYSAKTKVQRLPIEPISRASADQRKGRCGRVSDGICVRLYSKEDYESRPLYTDPEILRTNLAAVILQMISLHLGDIRDFPFIDAPQERQITDGIRLLEELGAIKDSKSKATDDLALTPIGTMLSKIPCDPRLSRMLVEGSKYSSLNEVLIIVSALGVMDPRERPLDKKEASDNYHSRFNDDKSDFMSYIKLYYYITSLQKTLSASAFKRQLKKEFISYLRVREWFDILRQLKASLQSLKFKFNTLEADYDAIHKAIISGLLSQIGMLDIKGNSYTGARGIKFLISKGSSVKKNPKWVCASVISETTRLFAREVAIIDPLWLESAASHLLKRTYNQPHWSSSQGAVMAYVTINLYGLPIVQSRLCQYKDIDPKLCRELFIRDGLVYGDIKCNYAFFNKNRELIDDVEYIEDKVRRKDLLVDASVMQDFYDKKIPQSIVTQRHFDKWWRDKLKDDPAYLDFSLELIAKDGFNDVKENLYPETILHNNLNLKLSYIFDIKDDRDGVCVHIPITVINQIKKDPFTWQIPGLREELVSEMIRSLPKRVRRSLIPAPDYAKAFLNSVEPLKGNIFEMAAKEFTRICGERITSTDFDLSSIDKHLFVTFVIEDLKGKELGASKDLDYLVAKMQGVAQDALQKVVKTHKSIKPSDKWVYGSIDKEKVTTQGSLNIISYPALCVKNKGVTIELFDNKIRQEQNMYAGLVKLLTLSIKNPTAYLQAHLPNKSKLSMYYQPLGSVSDLIDDLVKASIKKIIDDNGGLAWDEISFNKLSEIVRGNLNDTALEICSYVDKILYKAHEIKRLLKGSFGFDMALSYSDIQKQLDSLVYKGFISDTSLECLANIPRYLQAAIERINKLTRDVNKDLMYLRKLEALENKYYGALTQYPKDLYPKEFDDIKWMLEELRVSYFAQQLGVKGPISDKRIEVCIDNILKNNA